MIIKEIEELLERYYEGNTSLEEEKRLKTFFSQEEVPPHLKSHAAIFRFHSEEIKEELNDPRFEEALFLSTNEPAVVSIRSRTKYYYPVFAITATFLLLFGLLFTIEKDILDKEKKESQDPSMAFADTRQALMLVSVNLNNGLDKIQHLKVFEQGFQDIKRLSVFYKYQTIIINQDEKKRSQKH
jgi:hypothetical protein